MKNYKKHTTIKCIEKILIKYDFDYIFVGTITDDDKNTIDEINYKNNNIIVTYSNSSGYHNININNVNINIIEAIWQDLCSELIPEVLLDKTSFSISYFSKILTIEKNNLDYIPIETIEVWFNNLYETEDEQFESTNFQKLLLTDNFIIAYLNTIINDDIILIDKIKKKSRQKKFNL